jgi:hypothetical protein
MDIIDEANMTPEQKFMFMLEERLGKVEEDVYKINQFLYGDKKHMCKSAKTTHSFYLKIFESMKRKEIEEIKKELQKTLPEYVFNLVLDDLVEDFQTLTKYIDHKYIPNTKYRYYTVYKIIEKLGSKCTPDFIEWIDTHFKKEAEKILSS